MRIYGSIQIAFWESSDVQKLSDQSKLLAIYLLTGPHSNMLGCFRLPAGYITEDLKWDRKIAKNAFHQLSEMYFLTQDVFSSWVVIHDFLKWNPIQNPRQGVGIQKLFNAVPIQSEVIQPLINGLLSYGKYLDQGFVDRLHTLKKMAETLFEDCVADKEQNQDQNQDHDNKSLSSKPDVYRPSENGQEKKFQLQANEILQFLNEKAGRAYRPVDTNLKLIIARLKSGATLMDCRQVIAKKTREWKGNELMSEYLRPATLFNATKFEQYMGELVLPDEEDSAYGSD